MRKDGSLQKDRETVKTIITYLAEYREHKRAKQHESDLQTANAVLGFCCSAIWPGGHSTKRMAATSQGVLIGIMEKYEPTS
ncbi:hypothetical protein CLAFUW4_06604 [Fulvia fulva]|uniref:Uncharacterized protein n=1 Tax=Passalora fulva TaxID=5499 RepID=A0A9Q8PAH0_PASFU|nr:uncharacterized protein CLAFUR5_06749 [Fulvia fulva]KAK4622088.1 hypothetical protein CLAFUR4_06612 [Fulvia fulva]KAK4623400.1 hypothetical protein CLAFUR0_06606 [Fulvia fulva]UJO18874.1 hypothetical protein CLAFUR5_06749 [Fulvia fulva]WPV16655.1 hypothetical protein CLAFUW4_06604 [Fulvia fulva]WPV31006.1 hypothetical protein CLAFUW7_06603 [Fulvia fulva]